MTIGPAEAGQPMTRNVCAQTLTILPRSGRAGGGRAGGWVTLERAEASPARLVLLTSKTRLERSKKLPIIGANGNLSRERGPQKDAVLSRNAT